MTKLTDGALTHEYSLSFTIGGGANPIQVSGPGGVEHFDTAEAMVQWLEDELYEREADFWDEVGVGAALDTPEGYDLGRAPYEISLYMRDGGRHSVSHHDSEKCAQALEALADLGCKRRLRPTWDQLDGLKFQGRRSSIRPCGWPVAMASSVALR